MISFTIQGKEYIHVRPVSGVALATVGSLGLFGLRKLSLIKPLGIEKHLLFISISAIAKAIFDLGVYEALSVSYQNAQPDPPDEMYWRNILAAVNPKNPKLKLVKWAPIAMDMRFYGYFLTQFIQKENAFSALIAFAVYHTVCILEYFLTQGEVDVANANGYLSNAPARGLFFRMYPLGTCARYSLCSDSIDSSAYCGYPDDFL